MERIESAVHKAWEQRPTGAVVTPVALPHAQSGPNAAWLGLRAAPVHPKLMARNRIVTFGRTDPAHLSFDMLRTRLLQKLSEKSWTTIAITSPTAGCGKTLVALNLVFSLAKQRERRTVLVDLDLRRPRVAGLLGLANPPAIEACLKGKAEVEEALVRYGENVAVAANARPVQLAAELLESQSAAAFLKEIRRKLDPHVIIVDLPPMLTGDDVMAFAPNLDCAVLVAAAELTTLREIDLCERDLAEKTSVAGVVLNKCRYAPDTYGY
jgi:Mrp family chromosome partitioning ATPase